MTYYYEKELLTEKEVAFVHEKTLHVISLKSDGDYEINSYNPFDISDSEYEVFHGSARDAIKFAVEQQGY